MGIRKRTVITEETHEVWIIRHGDQANESDNACESDLQPAEVEPTLALEPIDDEV